MFGETRDKAQVRPTTPPAKSSRTLRRHHGGNAMAESWQSGRGRDVSMPLAASVRRFLLLASIALLLVVLWWAREVCVPLALAAMIAFVLTPPVMGLERRGIPRVFAVAVVVLAAIALVAGF